MQNDALQLGWETFFDKLSRRFNIQTLLIQLFMYLYV